MGRKNTPKRKKKISTDNAIRNEKQKALQMIQLYEIKETEKLIAKHINKFPDVTVEDTYIDKIKKMLEAGYWVAQKPTFTTIKELLLFDGENKLVEKVEVDFAKIFNAPVNDPLNNLLATPKPKSNLVTLKQFTKGE